MRKYFQLVVVFSIFLTACSNPFLSGDDKKKEDPPAQVKVDDKKTAKFICEEQNVNATEHLDKPIVLMISIDGFRYDYLKKYNPPNLLKMAKAGTRAEGLQPGFPTLTFPNHISLVTGMYPGHHGIVSNTFYDKQRKQRYSMGDGKAVNDGTWYRGEPLWATAEKNGMLSSIYFWVGSEAKISGVHPTCFAKYNGDVPNEDRGKKIIEWLGQSKEKLPHFIALYFSDVDSMGHKYGPDSKEVEKAVLEIDQIIGKINDFVEDKKLPVNFIVVSDHGMESLEHPKWIYVGDIINTRDFEIGDRGPVMMLYSDDARKIEHAYAELKRAEQNFKVYKRNEVPENLHFNDADKVGDLVLIADKPYYIADKTFLKSPPQNDPSKAPEPPPFTLPFKPPTSSLATHGWSPEHTNMRGLFIAKGPNFRSGQVAPVFENVHIYPLVLEILQITTTQQHDGDLSVLRPFLK